MQPRRVDIVERILRLFAEHGIGALIIAVASLVMLKGLKLSIIVVFGLPPLFAAFCTTSRFTWPTRRIAWGFLGAIGLGALIAHVPQLFPNLSGAHPQLGPWRDRMLTWYGAVYAIWITGVLPIYLFVGNLRAHRHKEPAQFSEFTCYLGLIVAAHCLIAMPMLLWALGFWPVI